MKISINATCFTNEPSGAKNRFIGIYGHLFKRFPENKFFVFEPQDCSVSDWFLPLPNVQFIQTDLSSRHSTWRYIKGLLVWKRELERIDSDIFETFTLPLVKSPVGKTILTVHDIRYIQYPEFYSQARGLTSPRILKKALNGADHVITVSYAMREELLKFCPNTDISVIYNGVDANAYNSISSAKLLSVKNKYKLI